MIDYTQHGFTHPAFVLDPIPSVAEYLDNYRDWNEQWYRSFAHPLEGGGWGARPSSFERRGVPPEMESQVIPDPAALPPIIQPDGMGEDSRVLAGDRPQGAIMRDVGDMTGPEVTAELDFLTGPGGYLGSLGAFAAGPGTGFGLIGGPMARSSVNDRIEELVFESLARGLDLSPVMASDDDRRGVSLARVGEPVTVALSDGGGGGEGGGQAEDQSSLAQAGLGDWDDETGFGGA